MTLTIPKGVENGHSIVFKGLGTQSLNPKTQESGNLVFQVVIEPHNFFTRNGKDLICKINIPFVKSMTGMDLSIPHFDGDLTVNTRQFGVINPALIYRIAGKGIDGGALVLQFVVNYNNLPLLMSDDDLKTIEKIFEKKNSNV